MDLGQSDLVDPSSLDPVLDHNSQPLPADMDLDPTDQNQVLDLNDPQVDLLPAISVRAPWMPTVFAPYIPGFSDASSLWHLDVAFVLGSPLEEKRKTLSVNSRTFFMSLKTKIPSTRFCVVVAPTMWERRLAT